MKGIKMSEEQQIGSTEESTPDEGQVEGVDGVSSPTDEGELPEGETKGSPKSADVPDKGQTSTLKQLSEKFGWTEENAAEEAAKMALGLETKLGNWKDIEAKAQAMDKLEPVLSSPKMKELLGTQEEEFDESQHTPQEIIDYRAEKKFEKLYNERVDPMIKSYYKDKADNAIAKVEAQYPDFGQYKEQINEYLDQRPWLAGDESTLIDVYKILTYDKAGEKGANEAIAKLKAKKDQSLGPAGTGAKTGPKKSGMSIREAFEAAEFEHS